MAKDGGCDRCGCESGWAGAALGVGVLTLPALFWASVFASLAGEPALERLLVIADWGLRIAESW